MKPINIGECHKVLLSIALEFDKICRKHQIPYYMMGGTMLGSIRHKGFIPWDDDMDFGVPRAYFAQLTEILSRELPLSMSVFTVNNADFMISNYIKIDDNQTRIQDIWLDKTAEIGINIDIFPLDEGLKSAFCTRLFASYLSSLMQLKDYLYCDPGKRVGLKKQIARFLQFVFPVKKKKFLKYIETCIQRHTVPDSGYCINFYGRWGIKEAVAKKIFGTPREYEFNTMKFYGVEHPDAYLTRLYGNYMQLPPVEKQAVHASEMYYRD
jgi:lipopolysaccharide cholinephosphotransferase